MTEYRATIGTVTRGGQVHLAHHIAEADRILCRFGAAAQSLTEVLAVLPEDGCADATTDALHAANVKSWRLCKQCFTPKFRRGYAEIGA
jgi:hypothetical protein